MRRAVLNSLFSKIAPARSIILLGLVLSAGLSVALIRAASVKGMGVDNVSAESSRLKIRGLYTQFDRRGWPCEYWFGQVISDFNVYDLLIGHTRAEEVALQLEKIRGMGVNTITYELRSCDPTYIPGFEPPICNMPPTLGLQYPDPTAKELANLVAFYDLVHSKGLKILLRLANTHMEQPTTRNARWLKPILEAIKNHPAFELACFEGNTHLIDTDGDGKGDACGTPAEPPLYLGPKSKPAKYVKWAIQLGISLGIPARKLSAEAIVGDFFVNNEPGAGPDATDRHLWEPIKILKGIFDDLSIPDDQRTYAISFYEHRKCLTARWIPCVEKNPHPWADETLTHVYDVIGRQNGARVIAVEMGLMTPVVPGWNAEQAMQSLALLMKKHGVDGGCYWEWVNAHTEEDADPTFADPIKRRGVPYLYNPVKDVLEKFYILEHAVLSPNGGEKWSANAANTIRWTYKGDLGPRVKIELYRGEDLAATIAEKALAGSNGEGSYRWKIPAGQTSGSDYKIRITSRKYPSYIDESDRPFRIVK